jgi:hypothetical protein
MQKLISFDIGIKNMAFCIFDLSGSPPSIQKWDVLNLMDAVETVQLLCTCHLKGKPAKKGTIPSSPKLCNKKDKYEKNNQYYCEKHATENTEYRIPQKDHSPPALRKMKADELLAISEKYSIFRKSYPTTVGTLDAFCNRGVSHDPAPETVIPTTKKGLLEKSLAFFEAKCFRVLQAPKKKTANETDLISIGRNMTKLLDQMPEITDGTITHVILENQISTIANRMKTIQGMLAQYFIMQSDDINIEFLSSIGKLKGFEKQNENLDSEYQQHKKDAIFYCNRFLEMDRYSAWKGVLDTKKKDDLADCFLQGIQWMKRKNIISFA